MDTEKKALGIQQMHDLLRKLDKEYYCSDTEIITNSKMAADELEKALIERGYTDYYSREDGIKNGQWSSTFTQKVFPHMYSDMTKDMVYEVLKEHLSTLTDAKVAAALQLTLRMLSDERKCG